MSDNVLGSSVDQHVEHLSFLGRGGHDAAHAHPTRILRRTQTQCLGLGQGLGPSTNPRHHNHHSHHHHLHCADDPVPGHAFSDHFGLAGAFLRRWGSRSSDHLHHYYHPQHQQYQHHHQFSRGFGPWRRAGSVRERPLHREHSLASVEIASWTARASTRRGSSLPLPFCSGLSPVEAAKKAETLEGVQVAIIKLFQRKPLKENELGTLQESVRALSEAEAGSLIYEYYKDQLLKKGMVILREKIKNEQGYELMQMLGETWDYFFSEILPTLQALMYPLAEATKDIDIRNTTLLEFRNIVVLKVGLKDAIDSKKYEVPVNVRQMLLVLQGLHDPTFLSKEQLDLEKLVACVVVPFLGSRGLYEGGPDPVTKANYRPTLPHLPLPKPKITITVSDTSAEETPVKTPRLLKMDHHPIVSPSAMRKLCLHEPSSSQNTLNHRLKPVMEVLDVGRRHSIVGT